MFGFKEQSQKLDAESQESSLNTEDDQKPVEVCYLVGCL